MNQAEFLRQARERALAKDRDGFEGRIAGRTPEERARVQALYEAFCRQHAIAKASALRPEAPGRA